jgi:hypothetical protein
MGQPRDVKAELAGRFPLLNRNALVPYEHGAVALGISEQGPAALQSRPRFEHTHVIGTTGGGKTNFLEHVIRQDIKNGHGVCVIDPHGSHPDSVYRSLITWLFAAGYTKRRVIHLVDPNAQSHVTGFNPLARPDAQTDPSVIASTVLEAFERVWGGEDTHSKPTIRRILKATFAALVELQLTLSEAGLLFDHRDEHGVRALALSRIEDRYARAVFTDLHRLAENDRSGGRFRDEVVGPINRLAEFVSAPSIRRIIGQRDTAIDLCRALDEGHIILVNLSGGQAVSESDSELLGRLLTRFLFFHAKRRKGSTPFWFYLDECQRYLSGDIPNLLAEARKFRVGVTLSHQWQTQLGGDDDTMLDAVQNATNLKVSFRIKHPKEAKEVAEAIIPIDLEIPVQALVKPTVVGHVRTTFGNWSTSTTETCGTSTSTSESTTTSESEGDSNTVTDSWGGNRNTSNGTGQSYTVPYVTGFFPVVPKDRMISSSRSAGEGSDWGGSRSSGSNSSVSTSSSHDESVTDSYSSSVSETYGESEGLEPIYETLPSAVHSYENALYLAAQKLRGLAAGQAYISYTDERGIQSARVTVPRVKQIAVSDGTFAGIRALIFSHSPSALPVTAAIEQLDHRERELLSAAASLAQDSDPPDAVEDFRVKGPPKKPRQ